VPRIRIAAEIDQQRSDYPELREAVGQRGALSRARSRPDVASTRATSMTPRCHPAREAAELPKPRPSFMETMRKIDHNRRTREALDAWASSEISAGDEGFDADQVVVASRAYLDGWMRRNYGSMGVLVAPLVAEDTPGKTAGMMREAFADELLAGYGLQRVSHTAAAVAIVDVILRVGGEEIEGAMRWIRHGEDGMAAAPNEPGRWGLLSWTKWGLIQHRRKS
jgi:hypothetical protein